MSRGLRRSDRPSFDQRLRR